MTAVRDRVMGTGVLVAGVPPAAAAAAFTALRRVEAVFSRFRPGSDLSRASAGAGRPVAVGPLFRTVLEQACAHAAASGGLFSPFLGHEIAAAGYGPAPARPGTGDGGQLRIDHDAGTVTVPAGTALDLGGFVKGWAVQQVADDLAAAGAPRGLVDAGGDVAAWRAADDEPWRIGVEHPHTGAALAVLDLPPRAAVATSSTARRRWTGPDGTPAHHVLDPRTGRPAATGRTQATVLLAGPGSGGLAAAEVAATVLLLGGDPPPGSRWFTVGDDGLVGSGAPGVGRGVAGPLGAAS